MFVRFSTVAGSRGSADTARDVRGFAVRFYTGEGNWDLVGNNIPVFFIQDGIKFPDLIHAAKPEPDREIPQAQTAHDTFWDFASLAPESTHMLMWIMSDRAIPRSYRTMEGFGVHTFRLVNADGDTTLVKFHWKPVAGMASLVWEEAQKLGGIDPDFHRRDLWDSHRGRVVPGVGPRRPGLPRHRRPDLRGHRPARPHQARPRGAGPGADHRAADPQPQPDQLLRRDRTGRLLHRARAPRDRLHRRPAPAGPELLLPRHPAHPAGRARTSTSCPINRPHSPVNTTQRDGFGQQAVPRASPPTTRTRSGGGCPFPAGAAGYVHVPRTVTGPRMRVRAQSFSDHYSQATLFWDSMSEPEQDHIVGAFSFELGKCLHEEIKDRMLANLANVSADLVARVAANLGKAAPNGDAGQTSSRHRRCRSSRPSQGRSPDG